MKPTIIRKTISFPVPLADAITEAAVEEQRSFSGQVVKAVRDFFCPQASDAATKEAE